MRSALVGLAGAVALGCASAGNPSPQQQAGLRDVAQTENGVILRTTPDYAIRGELPLPIDEAFAAMMLAYQKVGIELKTTDTGTHSLGNRTVSVVHQLHGQDLSRYFECGRDPMNGPRADHFRITFAAISTLTADGPSDTMVETLVTARGTDPAGATDVYCSSTGHLEAELIKIAKQK